MTSYASFSSCSSLQSTKGKDLLERNPICFPPQAGFPNASSEQKAAKLKRKRMSGSLNVNSVTDSVQSPTKKNAPKKQPAVILRLGSKVVDLLTWFYLIRYVLSQNCDMKWCGGDWLAKLVFSSFCFCFLQKLMMILVMGVITGAAL